MRRMWALITSSGFMAILAVLGFGFAIYTAFFLETKSRLVFTVSEPAKVFDIHKPIGGLEVTYAGESLRGGHNNLWTMSVVVKNEGNSEIRNGDYDQREPVGLLLNHGQLLEKPAVQSDSQYISNNVGISRLGNSVYFTPIIFEPGDSFTLNLLVLGADTVKPEVVPVGKIAGNGKIGVRSYEDRTESGVLADIFFAERWWVQLLRTLIYTFLFVAAIVIAVALTQALLHPFVLLRRKREKAERKKQVDGYRRGHPLSANERALGNLYAESGSDAVRGYYRVLLRMRTRARRFEKFGSVAVAAGQLNNELGDVPQNLIFELEFLEREGFADLREMSFELLTSAIGEVEEFCEYIQMDREELSRRSHNPFGLEIIRPRTFSPSEFEIIRGRD